MTTKSDTADKAAPGPKTSWNGAFSPEIIAQEGRASLDSVVEASTIAIKGYGAIGGAWFDFAKEALTAQTEALMGARSLTELADAQTGQAKTAFERTMAAGLHLTDMTVKTAGDAMKPIRVRAEDLAERYGKPIA